MMRGWYKWFKQFVEKFLDIVQRAFVFCVLRYLRKVTVFEITSQKFIRDLVT